MKIYHTSTKYQKLSIFFLKRVANYDTLGDTYMNGISPSIILIACSNHLFIQEKQIFNLTTGPSGHCFKQTMYTGYIGVKLIS